MKNNRINFLQYVTDQEQSLKDFSNGCTTEEIMFGYERSITYHIKTER